MDASNVGQSAVDRSCTARKEPVESGTGSANPSCGTRPSRTKEYWISPLETRVSPGAASRDTDALSAGARVATGLGGAAVVAHPQSAPHSMSGAIDIHALA
jgi:hypothetical protein